MPGLRPLRRDLLESALAFYEEFLRRGGDEPSILADLAATQARVGQILADLGERDKARVALRRAAELYDKTLAATAGRRRSCSSGSPRSGTGSAISTTVPISDGQRGLPASDRDPASGWPPSTRPRPRFRMALSRSFNGLAITSQAPASARRVSALARAAAEAGRRDPRGP